MSDDEPKNEYQSLMVPLSGAFSDLTVAYACDRKPPSAEALPKLSRILWRDLALPAVDASVRLDGHFLVVEFHASSDAVLHRINFEEHPARLDLEDGSKIGGAGRFTSRQGSSTGTRLTLNLYEWEWDTGHSADFLAARIGGMPKVRHDNLVVQDGSRAGIHHFRGEGHAAWHIVSTDDGHVAVVERRAATWEELRVDVHALEFAFGADIDLTTLWKVTDEGVVVGAVDLRRSPPATHDRRIPVPWGGLVRECWPAHIFGLIAKTYLKDKALRTAMRGYLDALSGHVHSAYLLAQVALEASCKEWRQTEPPLLVRSPTEWEAWVDSQAPEIAKHAPDDEATEQLVKKLKSVVRSSSSRVVKEAFASAGIHLDRSLLKEVVLRNSVAHNFYMIDDEALNEKLEETIQRIHVIQTLLAAVVAVRCGYKGPLAGWTRDRAGYLETASFWKGESHPLARTYFICGRDPASPNSGQPQREDGRPAGGPVGAG